MRNRRRNVFWYWFPVCLLSALGFAHCGQSPQRDPIRSCDDTDRIDRLAVDTMRTHIVIDKSDYTLKLFEGDKLLRCYPVVLGFDPVQDKRFEGDGCTPEGKFKVRTKYDHAKWSKFIWVDYPTEESWAKFNARKAAGEIPADATIGGDIGIHGVPEGREDLIDRKQNWTLGCISLTRKDVDELYHSIRTGTEITIKQ